MSETGANGPLSGKLALVAGASRGIGAATAIELAARGAHVIITARDDRALERVEEQIHQAGGHATIAPMDLSEPDAVARLAAAVRSRWDTLDIMVICAAVMPQLSGVQDIDAKQFSKALTVNVLATQTLIAAFHPMLKRSGDARLIGLTSSVGASPRAFWAGYGATKAAFDNLLASYAAENAKVANIRTAIVDPGATRTDMRARAYPGEDPETVKEPAVVARRIADLAEQDFVTGHRERVNQK